MTLVKALDYFKKSAFSNEEIERYVPCKDGIILITKGEDEFEDDYVVGDVVYFLVNPNGRVQPITPADCEFDASAIKNI